MPKIDIVRNMHIAQGVGDGRKRRDVGADCKNELGPGAYAPLTQARSLAAILVTMRRRSVAPDSSGVNERQICNDSGRAAISVVARAAPVAASHQVMRKPSGLGP